MHEFEVMFKNSPDEMFFGESPEERMATLTGQIVMIELMYSTALPGIERLRAFHKLRVAARHCPNAAYNLGNYLSDPPEKTRRHREKLALELFTRAAEMGLSRLRNPDEPYKKAPRREGALRDIISRALTNIGGKVANAGRPADAVQYFQQSIKLFHDNPNSHVCLGNMGVYHGESTKVSAMDGIRAWKEAGRIGDYCHESQNGCPCRANVVGVAERIAKNYGESVAETWLTTRHRKSCERRHHSHVVDVIASAADAKKIGVAISASAARASKVILDTGFVQRMRKEPLEVRVTVMASAVGTFLNMTNDHPRESVKTLEYARHACAKFEPLVAVLAEEDWRDLGPPETDYLNEEATRERLAEMVYELIMPVAETASSALDGVIAMFSHLDVSFRHGVSGMVEYWLPTVRRGLPLYIPATMVGNPSLQ